MNPTAVNRELPRSVRQLVYGVLTDAHRPQWIETDAALIVSRVMGEELVTDLQTGDSLADALPCIVGAESIAPVMFPAINLNDQRAVDVHIFRSGDGFEVLLLDASDQHANDRRLQQQSYEVALLNRRLNKLTLELESARASAEAASEAKGRFIAGMSHEFRTPLTSILGFSDLLKRDIGDPRESLESINDSASYLVSLVDNLLEHGALEQGEIRLQTEQVELETFFESLARLARPLAARKGLDFVLLGPEESTSHWIEVDVLRFRQILVNLLSNAVRYTARGSITLQWTCSNSQTVVAVTDTGAGISEADQQRIFLPYTRATGGPVDSKSLGLGLAICQRLAQAMAGRLKVSSAVGRGSTFSLELDVQCSRAPFAKPPALHAGRVLVVDDDANIRAVLELALTDQGFDVQTAGDQAAADATARQFKPELALVDLDLYGQSGLDVIDRLRQENPAMPVFAMSAANSDRVRRAVKQAGCAGFIEKPFDFKGVGLVIDRAIAATRT